MIRAVWEQFWWRPEGRLNLAMTRVIVAATMLWIVLSRHDLPEVVAFPREWWNLVLPERKMRFFLFFGLGTERVLWIVLHVALFAVLFGVVTRWACLIGGLLLYHFGALEAVLWTGNPYLRGYTIPCLALLIIAASASAGRFLRHFPDHPTWENRWPLALIQFLFAGIYFWAAYSKLYASGLPWLHAENMRLYIAGIEQYLDLPHPPLNLFLMAHPLLLSGMAFAGLLFDAVFPIVLIWPASKRVILPVAAFFHLANGFVFHIWFQNAWLLLMFVDWNALLRQRRIGGWRP